MKRQRQKNGEKTTAKKNKNKNARARKHIWKKKQLNTEINFDSKKTSNLYYRIPQVIGDIRYVLSDAGVKMTMKPKGFWYTF